MGGRVVEHKRVPNATKHPFMGITPPPPKAMDWGWPSWPPTYPPATCTKNIHSFWTFLCGRLPNSCRSQPYGTCIFPRYNRPSYFHWSHWTGCWLLPCWTVLQGIVLCYNELETMSWKKLNTCIALHLECSLTDQWTLNMDSNASL